MSRRKPSTINDETRRLQKVLAVLIALHAAVEEGAEFDVGDALAVLIPLVNEALAGLDRLEAAP